MQALDLYLTAEAHRARFGFDTAALDDAQAARLRRQFAVFVAAPSGTQRA